jgi:hypothetical protein
MSSEQAKHWILLERHYSQPIKAEMKSLSILEGKGEAS